LVTITRIERFLEDLTAVSSDCVDCGEASVGSVTLTRKLDPTDQMEQRFCSPHLSRIVNGLLSDGLYDGGATMLVAMNG
jgi:hypothetical protein